MKAICWLAMLMVVSLPAMAGDEAPFDELLMEGGLLQLDATLPLDIDDVYQYDWAVGQRSWWYAGLHMMRLDKLEAQSYRGYAGRKWKLRKRVAIELNAGWRSISEPDMRRLFSDDTLDLRLALSVSF